MSSDRIIGLVLVGLTLFACQPQNAIVASVTPTRLVLVPTSALLSTPTVTSTPTVSPTPTPTATALVTPTLPPRADAGYRRETTWQLIGEPNVNAMRPTIAQTFQQRQISFNGPLELVSGFSPGEGYPYIFARDTTTMLPTVAYFYPDAYLRTPIEGFLAQQYDEVTASSDGDNGMLPGRGALSTLISADGRVNKSTVASDDETMLIHGAFVYDRSVGGAAWLTKTIRGQTILARLDAALTWLFAHRFDEATGLIRRGHTTDWGDVKAERDNTPTDFAPDRDHWTASIYDQVLTYRAALELARLHRVVRADARAADWETRAAKLRAQTQRLLWQPAHGFFRMHLHITPWSHDFDEYAMVSIMNALAVDVGLATPAQAESIFDNLERVRREAGVRKPGLVLYPPYPAGFLSAQGGRGEYQNGGVWDWWGGMQITAEFQNGAAARALEHLTQVATDWARHPDQIFEWQDPRSLDGRGSAHYASAAGTMGEAILRGLFGVEVSLDGVTLQPRLGWREGSVRVYQPSTDRYAAYAYRVAPTTIVMDYGTNVAQSVSLKILLPAGARQIRVDDQEVAFTRECKGKDCYAVFAAPSGSHRVVVWLQ